MDAVHGAIWAQLGVQLARAEPDAHKAAENSLALRAGADVDH